MREAGLSSRLSASLEVVARLGYGARGFVYLSVGGLALLADLQTRGTPSGSKGAIAVIAQWPLGRIWIVAVGVGLTCFAVWRALQSVLDADRQGGSRKALLARAGQAISAMVYGTLAWTTFGLLPLLRQVSPPEEEASAHAGAAHLLAWPYGGWLLIGLGLFVGGGGVANIMRAVRGDVGGRLVCGPAIHLWARRFGRLGYLGRGIAFLPLGFFLCRAGFTLDPQDARSLGGALTWLQDQLLGGWILAFIAVELMAFGIYGLIEAWFRRIDIDAAKHHPRAAHQ